MWNVTERQDRTKSRSHTKRGPGRMPVARTATPRKLKGHAELLAETNAMREAMSTPKRPLQPLGPRHLRRSERG